MKTNNFWGVLVAQKRNKWPQFAVHPLTLAFDGISCDSYVTFVSGLQNKKKVRTEIPDLHTQYGTTCKPNIHKHTHTHP